MIELGGYIRDIFELNKENQELPYLWTRRVCPTVCTKYLKQRTVIGMQNYCDTDDCLARDGRIMDGMLSEHMCEGWLEGYLLTGRHGFFASYEAFIRVVDSMAAQHAKWLKVM